MRNWPYADAILDTASDSKVDGQVRHRAAARASADNRVRPASVGTASRSACTRKHKATALDFLKFVESDAVQRYDLTQGTLAPVITALYSDPALVAKFPYLPTLLTEHPERGAAPGHPVLPGGDQGDRDQRLRGAAGRRNRVQQALEGSPGGDQLGSQRRRLSLITAGSVGRARSSCVPPRRLQSDPLGRR